MDMGGITGMGFVGVGVEIGLHRSFHWVELPRQLPLDR
jgi:hypothetical protein